MLKKKCEPNKIVSITSCARALREYIDSAQPLTVDGLREEVDRHVQEILGRLDLESSKILWFKPIRACREKIKSFLLLSLIIPPINEEVLTAISEAEGDDYPELYENVGEKTESAIELGLKEYSLATPPQNSGIEEERSSTSDIDGGSIPLAANWKEKVIIESLEEELRMQHKKSMLKLNLFRFFVAFIRVLIRIMPGSPGLLGITEIRKYLEERFQGLNYDRIPTDTNPYPHTERRINGGYGTALRFMTMMSESIRIAVKRDLPDEEISAELLISTYENSFKSLVRIATMITSSLVELETQLVSKPNKSQFGFHPRKLAGYLRAKKKGDKVDIDIDRSIFVKVPDFWSGPRLGCPALINFGEEHVIKKLFQKIKEKVAYTYRKKYPKNQ